MNDNKKPPKETKPELTFRPSVDDRDQLDAYLKGVVQQYAEKGGAKIAQEPSSQAHAPKMREDNDTSSSTDQATEVKGMSIASSSHRTGLSRLKVPPVYQHLESNILTNSSIISQPTQNIGPNEMAMAQGGMHPSIALQVLPGYAAVPLASDLPKHSSTQSLKFSQSYKDAKARDLANHPPSRAAAPRSPAQQETKKPPRSSRRSKTGKKTPKVNHELIQRQLDAIGRSSLLRARTVDIHAPDPELDAPPNETPVGKRRRLERINGRRKRAKKLIEIDSLNEQLVNLSEQNKELKAENADCRQKISVVKRLMAEGRTNFAEITTSQAQLDTDARKSPKQEQVQEVASRVSTRPSDSPTATFPSFPTPQQQYPPQRQPEIPPMESHSEQQQSMLSSLLSSLSPAPAANYASLLANYSATNQSLHLVGQPPYLFRAQAQQQSQLSLQQQLQLQYQVRMQNQAELQRQLRYQLPPQQDQRFHPAQQAGMSHTGSSQLSLSSLYSGSSQGLRNSAGSNFAQYLQGAAASDARKITAATRSCSPTPRNATELKAWIQKHGR